MDLTREFLNVCRLCMRTSEDVWDMFEDEEHCKLISKISLIAPIEITYEDQLPKTVCKGCMEELSKFYEFRETIIKSDVELKKKIGSLIEAYQKKKRKKRNKTELSVDSKNISDDIGAIKNEMPSCNVECNKSKNHGPRHSICTVCGKTVKGGNIHKHLKMHTDKPQTCEVCKKVFKHSESLRSHMILHRDIRHECNLCEKTYAYKGELTRHKKKKHGEQPIVFEYCDMCGKGFTSKSSVKKHIRCTHNHERSYVCIHCSKGLSSSYALKIHLRLHTKEFPFMCEFCSMAFPQNCSLQTHIKSKHIKQEAVEKTGISSEPEVAITV